MLSGVHTFGKWRLQKDDFAVGENLSNMMLKGKGELLVIKTPTLLPYKTYAEKTHRITA